MLRWKTVNRKELRRLARRISCVMRKRISDPSQFTLLRLLEAYPDATITVFTHPLLGLTTGNNNNNLDSSKKKVVAYSFPFAGTQCRGHGVLQNLMVPGRVGIVLN